MSTHINTQDLRQFVISNYGMELTKNEAKELGVSEKEYNEAVADENEYSININDALDIEDIVAQFTKEYIAEQEEQAAEDKDKKEERLNKDRTSGKSDAKA